MSTARVRSRTSTPICSRCLRVYSCSFGANGGSTAPAPSNRMIRASLVSTAGSREAARCAPARRSARPARLRSGRRRSRRRSASRRAPAGRSRPRPSRTWSGWRRAGIGRPPRSSCPARTRRTCRCRSRSGSPQPPPPASRSGSSIGRPSGPPAETTRRSRSMSCTSASNARALACFSMMARIAGAISPGGRIPAATWYSSGWNRWWLVRSTTVTSTSAPARARVAFNPPKPLPITTTRCRSAVIWNISYVGWPSSASDALYSGVLTRRVVAPQRARPGVACSSPVREQVKLQVQEPFAQSVGNSPTSGRQT